MRVIKAVLNTRVNADMNYSLTTEVLVDEAADAKEVGRDACAFLVDFQEGMIEKAAELDGGGEGR